MYFLTRALLPLIGVGRWTMKTSTGSTLFSVEGFSPSSEADWAVGVLMCSLTKRFGHCDQHRGQSATGTDFTAGIVLSEAHVSALYAGMARTSASALSPLCDQADRVIARGG